MNTETVRELPLTGDEGVDRFHHGLNMFVNHRIRPGNFLCAVLRNDLRDAIGRADEWTLSRLRDIVSYCHMNLPMMCWGSREKFEAWLVGGDQ